METAKIEFMFEILANGIFGTEPELTKSNNLRCRKI